MNKYFGKIFNLWSIFFVVTELKEVKETCIWCSLILEDEPNQEIWSDWLAQNGATVKEQDSGLKSSGNMPIPLSGHKLMCYTWSL
jgi:hypothetical protein